MGSKATTISLPNTVTGLTGAVFSNMNSLTTIQIEEDNPNYTLIEGSLYSKNGETLIKWTKNETIATIPEGVTTLTKYSITKTKIQQIILPETLTTIEKYALHSATGITLIELPKNVKTVTGEGGLPINAKIRVVEENTNLKSVDDSMILSKDGKTLYVTSRVVGEFEIPDTVETIYQYAFYMNTNIQEIEIPEGVKSIGYKAFYQCTNLIKITIPSTVTSIDTKAFELCSNLQKIQINKASGSITGSPWSCPYGARAVIWK